MGGSVGRFLDPTSSGYLGGYGNYADPLNFGRRSNGKGGKGGGPQPPDFAAAAETQARTSRNDVNGMFGGAKWSQTPDGRWSLDLTMSPELQAASRNLMSQVANG